MLKYVLEIHAIFNDNSINYIQHGLTIWFKRVGKGNVNLMLNGRLETASTQAKPTCVGFKSLIFL
ncbi:MAG: hypothetical protein PT120_23580 [Aphanizomenon gracile PMC649.10]|nr:hypothetical protein [Aphanizomenon gracile PMC627.10]MDM3857787.1 hypothetical protein [Aphanizomenon gracile PMC649.10]MDM3860700.1 hypothetical protein [Aphanizomenon gracile PMC644.10]